MAKSHRPHKKTTVGGGCKVLLTLALLMLLSVVTAGKAAAQETKAYAVLTTNDDGENTKTLTFYYDNEYSEGANTWAFPSYGYPGWKENTNITKVEITKDFHNFTPESSMYWFYGLKNLKEIKGIENINTSKVTAMYGMFQDCYALTSLDLSSFNTAEVKYMTSMFSRCTSLTSLNLSSFNTTNVTNMVNMFYGCASLKSLDLSSFNTAKVEYMSNMFQSCSVLKSLDLSSFNTEKVQEMDGMFSGCQELTSLDLSSFNTEEVKKMDRMFSYSALATIFIGEIWGDKNITDDMIVGCDKKPSVILEKPYVVLEDNGKTLRFWFGPDGSQPEGAMDLSSANWANNASNITKVVFDNMFRYARPESCAAWFVGFSKLTEIKGIEYLNTSIVTDMRGMFQGCSALTSLDLSRFNTAKVENMIGMFHGCSALTSLDLSSFNTAKVTDMGYMFNGCSALTSLDLSSFNTAQVTIMSYMFSDCSALTSLDLSSFNTASVQFMDAMFYGCSALMSLDLSSFNIASVQDMDGMFQDCNKLTTILVVENLWEIKEGAIGEDMFNGCNSLVGGNGTKYESGSITGIEYAITYAIIDGDEDKPGYLTSKSRCEPYAMLKDNGKTLKFCYGYKPEEGAMVLDYSLWENDASNITKVEFDNMFQYARPESCESWFEGLENLTEIIGIEYLNTSQVTNMGYMYHGCKKLTSLDLSSFNTENVEFMRNMFYGCEKLTSLDLSSFNTAKVTDMGYMFNGCSALTSLDLSSFNTASVRFMDDMFQGCQSLTSLDLSSFNTARVELMYCMFQDCSALTTILVVENLWEIKEGASGDAMFNGCENLVGGNGTTYLPEQITGIEYAIIDGGEDNPGYLTSKSRCEPYAMLKDNNQTLKFCYGYKPKTGAMDLDYPHWENDASNITKVEFDNLFKYARPEMCAYWFNGCTNLTEIIGIENLNTSKVTDMYAMFWNCSALTSLDLSSFNTASVQDMSVMFNGCEKLTSLDLSSFNTASVQFMNIMFYGCESLTTILVDKNLWNITSVTSGEDMFYGCTNLVGGNGTKCDGDENNINLTYAIVDGDGGEGYLTHNALKLTKSNGKTTAELYGDIDGGIGAAVSVDKETKVSQVTFYRSFTQGVTATVMFPFSFTADDKIKGTFRTLSKVAPDDNGVWTAELSYPITDIQANTPYIFSPSGNIESITFTGENGNGITLLPVTGDLTNGANDGWQLHGVYSKKIWTEESKKEYGFAGEEADGIKAGEFVRAGEGAWADPMRCYLTYKGKDNPFTAKAATVLPDRIRVVFPEDKDEDTGEEITTDPDEVITPVSPVTEKADTKVWAYNRTIFIESPTGSEYTVIDINGRQIKASTTESTHEEVNISKPGVYVVIIGGKAVKVTVF